MNRPVSGLKICTFIIIASAPAFSAPAPPAERGWTDTLRTIPMKEVVVTATRSPLPADRSPSRVSVLSKEEIDLRQGETLGELVSGMPGLFVRAYGTGGG